MELSVVSLNIEGNRHLDLVKLFLQQERADIICLQEVFEVHVAELAEATGMIPFYTRMSNVTFASIHADPFGYLGLLQLVHPRLHILQQQAEYYFGDSTNIPIFFENENPNSINRAILWCKVAEKSEEITVATTHFTWSPKGQTTDEQLQDFTAMEKILDRVQPDIFCGDFNAPRGGKIFDTLAQRFVDSIPREATTTIDGSLHKSGKDIQLVVDGMFTKPGLRMNNVRIVKGISDHYAVVGNLELR